MILEKRTNPFVLSAAAEAARPRLAMRGYIGKGKASLLSQLPVTVLECARPAEGRDVAPRLNTGG